MSKATAAQKQDPEIPDEAQALILEATKTVEVAKSLTINNNEEYETAASQLSAIKKKANELDTKRKSMTKPLDEAKKKIMDLFRDPIQKLNDAEGFIKRGIASYQHKLEMARREEQRKADEAARKERERLERHAAKAAEKGRDEKAQEFEERASMVQAPVVAYEAPKVSGVSTRENWKAEVTDLPALVKAVAEGKAPASFLTANMTEINRVAKALRKDADYPGVRVYSETVVASR